MMERDTGATHLDEIRNYILATAKRYIKHIREAHQGVPSPTCHSCLSMQQALQSNTKYLNALKSGQFS